MNTATLVSALALGAALLSAPALAASDKPNAAGEAELAKLLEGRVAGKPVNCIELSEARESQIIDGTAIVYNSGSVLYVNRPRYPQSLRSDDILVTKTWGSELCSIDTVQLRSRPGFTYDGFVALEQFVPYTRAPMPAPSATPAAH